MNFFSKYMGSAALMLLATTVVSANAADLPAKAYVPAPVAAQVYNWTGLYVGVNGGYGWGAQDPLTIISNRFDAKPSISMAGCSVGPWVPESSRDMWCSVIRGTSIGPT